MHGAYINDYSKYTDDWRYSQVIFFESYTMPKQQVIQQGQDKPKGYMDTFTVIHDQNYTIVGL